MRKMKLGLLAAASLALTAGAAMAAGPVGLWRDNDKGAEIKVSECGAGLCVQIAKPSDPVAKDKNNPDPSLRGRSLAGLTLISGAKQSAANVWQGDVYNVEDGRVYSGSLTLVSEARLQMEGCALAGLVCKTRTFSRIK